jgi:hypothetical protein
MINEIHVYYNKICIKATEMECTKQQRKRRKTPHIPKPEEHEGMPQHQHCPHVKHSKDKNPKYHEEQYSDVA